MDELNQQQDNDNIQELRDAADRGREATKRADKLERELAFSRAGIDTETPLGRMFADAYKGELDKEAVKAAWSEIAGAAGGNAQEPPAQQEEKQVEQSETDERRRLTTGGAGETPHEQPDPDPVQSGYKNFQERLRDGEPREKAAGSVFGALIGAAAKGDKRAIFSGWSDEDLGR